MKILLLLLPVLLQAVDVNKTVCMGHKKSYQKGNCCETNSSVCLAPDGRQVMSSRHQTEIMRHDAFHAHSDKHLHHKHEYIHVRCPEDSAWLVTEKVASTVHHLHNITLLGSDASWVKMTSDNITIVYSSRTNQTCTRGQSGRRGNILQWPYSKVTVKALYGDIIPYFDKCIPTPEDDCKWRGGLSYWSPNEPDMGLAHYVALTPRNMWDYKIYIDRTTCSTTNCIFSAGYQRIRDNAIAVWTGQIPDYKWPFVHCPHPGFRFPSNAGTPVCYHKVDYASAALQGIARPNPGPSSWCCLEEALDHEACKNYQNICTPHWRYEGTRANAFCIEYDSHMCYDQTTSCSTWNCKNRAYNGDPTKYWLEDLEKKDIDIAMQDCMRWSSNKNVPSLYGGAASWHHYQPYLTGRGRCPSDAVLANRMKYFKQKWPWDTFIEQGKTLEAQAKERVDKGIERENKAKAYKQELHLLEKDQTSALRGYAMRRL